MQIIKLGRQAAKHIFKQTNSVLFDRWWTVQLGWEGLSCQLEGTKWYAKSWMFCPTANNLVCCLPFRSKLARKASKMRHLSDIIVGLATVLHTSGFRSREFRDRSVIALWPLHTVYMYIVLWHPPHHESCVVTSCVNVHPVMWHH